MCIKCPVDVHNITADLSSSKGTQYELSVQLFLQAVKDSLVKVFALYFPS